MRQEINGQDLEKIVGGTVIISDHGVIGFKTTREKFTFTGITYRNLTNYVADLLEAHSDMSDEAFDAFVKDDLKKHGWI